MFMDLLHLLYVVPLVQILDSWKFFNVSTRGDPISVITVTILLDFTGKSFKKRRHPIKESMVSHWIHCKNL